MPSLRKTECYHMGLDEGLIHCAEKTAIRVESTESPAHWPAACCLLPAALSAAEGIG